LICFNDEPVLRLTQPSISAIAVQAQQMGQTAARLLLRQMGDENAGNLPMAAADIVDPTSLTQRRCVKIAEFLVARESTAPPV
jgi:DNA-binding LacI/PurR family transcriptional regulator